MAVGRAEQSIHHTVYTEAHTMYVCACVYIIFNEYIFIYERYVYTVYYT